MATKSTVTGKVDVDLILEPGKILGEETIRNALVKAVRGMDLPPIKATQDIDLGTSVKDITKKIQKVMKEVNQVTSGNLKIDESSFAGMNPDQLKRVESGYRRLHALAREGNRLRDSDEFKGKDFEKALRLWDQGYVSDGKGGKRKLTSANAGGFTNITDSEGKPLFSKSMLTRLERYTAQMHKFAAASREAAKAVTKIESVDALKGSADGKKQPVLGQSTKTQGTDLEVLAARAKRDADAMQKRFVTSEQALKDEQDLAKKRVQEANRVALERRREAAKDKTYEKKQNRDLSAGRGVGSLARFSRGQTLNVEEYDDALTLLGRKIAKTAKEQNKLYKKTGQKVGEDADKLTAKMSTLKLQIDAVKKAKAKLYKPPPQEFIGPPRPGQQFPPGVAASFLPTGVDRNKFSNQYASGKEAFLRSGGFGGTFSARKSDLSDLTKFHEQRISTLNSQQGRLNRSIASEAKIYDANKIALRKHAADLDHARSRMQEFGSATQQAGALFRQFFRYALGYGALYKVLTGVRALTAGIVDLDTALKGIQAVTQATDKQMQSIETGIKNVALVTQFNAKEIAEAAQILGQAGVIPQELPSALRATAQFASATGSTLQLSADLVTSMRNVFTDLSDDSIANQLTQAINISKLTAGDLKTVVSLSGQIAKSYSLTADQYFAAVTTLRNAGIKPSTVATGLRQGLIEIFSPDSKTVTALKKRYAKLGEDLSSSDIRDKFFSFQLDGNPLISALRELKRLGFTGEGKKDFQRAYDIRAENAISALINNLEEVETASSKLTFGNAAMLAAQTQMEALSHSFSNMNAAISVFAHDLSGGVVGGLEDMADAVTEVVKDLTDLNLEMQTLQGSSAWLQALGGAVGAAIGVKYFKGGIPGKAVVGAATAYSGAALVNQGVQAKNAEEEAEGAVRTVWEGITDAFFNILPSVAAVLGVELLNKSRAKGSPLLDTLFSKKGVAGTGDVRPGIAPRAASFTPAKAAAAVAGGKAATAATRATLTVFAAGFWVVLKKAAVGLFFFLKKNPIVLALTAMQLIFPYFNDIADAVGDLLDPTGAKKLKRRLDGAVKRRDRAAVEYDALIRTQEEFEFSDKDSKAKAGTTAEAIEKMESNLSSYQQGLTDYFGANAKDTQQLTNLLLDFINKAPEAGTEDAEAAYTEFQAAIKKAEVTTAIDDSALRDLAYRGREAINSANSMRQSIAKLVANLRDKGDKLGASDKAFLEAFDSLTKNDLKTEQLIYGASLGDNAIESADRFNKFLRRFLNEQQRLFKLTDEYKKTQAAALESQADAISLAIQSIQNDPSRAALLQAIEKVGSSMSYMLDEGIEALDELIEAIDKERAALAEKVIKSGADVNRDDLLALANAKRVRESYLSGNRPTPNDSGATLLRLASAIEELEDKLGGSEKSAADADLLEKLIASERLAGEARGKREEYVGARSADQEAVTRKFISDAKTLYDTFLGQDASPSNKAAFQNRVLSRGEREDTGTLRLAAETLAGAIAKGELTAENLPATKDGGSPIPPEWLEVIEVGKKIYQQQLDQAADYAKNFNDLPQYRKIIEAEDAIESAKNRKDYDALTTEELTEDGKLKNLYRIWEALKIKDLHNRITHLQNQSPESEAEENRRQKDIFDLEHQQAKVRADAQAGINKAIVDQGNALVKDLKASNRRLLDGLKTQRGIAIDSGDYAEADRLDTEILAIKEQILAAEVDRLRRAEASEAEIDAFIYDSRQDMIRELSKPAALRTVGTRIQARIDRETPKEPRLSKDNVRAGYLQQQGKLPTRGQQTEANDARLAGIEKDIAGVYEQMGREQDRVGGPLSEERVEIYQQQIRELQEEIGRLRGENQDNEGFSGLGSINQLKKGFDLVNVSSAIDKSESSIANLGNTIQQDLVGGLDNAADGFANALANGESFTDGLRQSFSDMFRQIAADMIKSGILSMFSQGAFSLGTFFGTGASTGGTVGQQKLAGGGLIRGPGTGTSDSVQGAVVDARGRVVRGVRVSDGEGILTAKAMKGLGTGVLNSLNEASDGTLKALRKMMVGGGYRSGGVPSPVRNPAMALAGAKIAFTSPVMGYAGGGLIQDASSTVKGVRTAGMEANVTEHNVQTSVNIKTDGDSGMTLDDLRRLDDGINLKIQEYIEDQLRPGGSLQSARGR
jgi:TP901 family phage tail tape measure protein